MKEIKKGINWKENTLANKKKVKEIIKKIKKNITSGNSWTQ